MFSHADKPKFLCTDTVYSELHKIELNITCKVRADPPVIHASFFWEHMSSGNTSLEPDEREGHYFAEMLEGVNTNLTNESCFVVYSLTLFSPFVLLFMSPEGKNRD